MIRGRLALNGLILLGWAISGIEARLARRRALDVAGRALSEVLGSRVRLETQESFAGSTQLCRVVGGMSGDPESVIVKRPNRRGGKDFDPDDADPQGMAVRAGPWATYVHGDAGADNLRLGSGRSQLLDFEHGGVRHALTDAAFPRMKFPTSFRVASFPDDATLEVEECYRREVAQSIPMARDAAVFRRRLLDGCAFWIFLTLTYSLRSASGPEDRGSALDGDPDWGLSTLRQIVLGRLQAFLDFAQELNAFPEWRESLGLLSAVVKQRWGDVLRLPLFPAFRASFEEEHV